MVEKHRKTIIITTHYIEEANLANCVSPYFCKLIYIYNLYTCEVSSIKFKFVNT